MSKAKANVFNVIKRDIERRTVQREINHQMRKKTKARLFLARCRNRLVIAKHGFSTPVQAIICQTKSNGLAAT